MRQNDTKNNELNYPKLTILLLQVMNEKTKLSHSSNTLILHQGWNVIIATNCHLKFWINDLKLVFMIIFRPLIIDIDRWW